MQDLTKPSHDESIAASVCEADSSWPLIRVGHRETESLRPLARNVGEPAPQIWAFARVRLQGAIMGTDHFFLKIKYFLKTFERI